MILPDGIPNYEEGRVIGVLGRPGTGKTTDLAEIILGTDLPVWVVDTVGALKQRVTSSPRYMHADFPPMIDEDMGMVEDVWNLTEENLGKGGIVVWDMRQVSPLRISRIVDHVTDSVLHDLRDVVVVFDEAHRVIGEPRFGGGQARSFSSWITVRRNYGITFVYSSQRPAFVDMSVRAVTDAWIVHALGHHRDLQAVTDALESARPDDGFDVEPYVSRLPRLPRGEALIVVHPFDQI